LARLLNASNRVKRAVLRATLALVAIVTLAWMLWPPFHTSYRTRLIDALETYFRTEVELGSLEVSFFPRIRAHGTRLVIKRPGPASSTPLISIESFQAEANLLDLARRTLRARRVALKGLTLNIPPKRDRKGARVDAGKIARSGLIIDELVSDEATLTIETEKPRRLPLVFPIHRLHLQGFGFSRPTTFNATLINPVPPGEVQAKGQFGPWVPDEPRLTPIAGHYVFARADLSVFEGLAGILSSRGSFEGRLEEIGVKGVTTTPDFLLTKTGQPVKLDSVFDVVVDGTNGDTILKQVTATVLSTTIVAQGRVVKTDTPQKGRLIEMNVQIDDGRLEDVIRLAVKSKTPPMLGQLGLTTRMVLPPGKTEVIERLALEGSFSVRSGRFSSPAVQRRIGDLSRRGRGEPQAPIPDRVFSNLNGSFTLRNAALGLSSMTFAVDGASVQLAGTYAVQNETLDFKGTLRLRAKPSQTVTGFKSFLLKLVDPLLRGKSAGTELPITVQGTVHRPRFGINVKQTLTRATF
jgi:hypothetical protein